MDDQNLQQSQVRIEIPEEMQLFLKNLIKDAGIHPVNDEMEDDMVRQLFPQLDQFVMMQITTNMPEDKVDPFMDLIESKKPQNEIEQFLLDSMPNAREIMSKAFLDFREMYLQNAQKAQGRS